MAHPVVIAQRAGGGTQVRVSLADSWKMAPRPVATQRRADLPFLIRRTKARRNAADLPNPIIRPLSVSC